MTSSITSLVLFLERAGTKATLSLLILLSVSPIPFMARIWWVFFAIFAFEVAVRAAAAIQNRGISRSQAVVLVLDVIATTAFLPITQIPHARLLRLLRLAALLGYWLPFASDLAALTGRPERRRQIAFVVALVAALCTVTAILVTNIGVPLDTNSDGIVSETDRGFVHAFYWAFRQIESADNIAMRPQRTLAFVLSVFLTLAGLFVFSFFIGIGATLVGDLVEVSRLQRVGYQNHVVVLNPSPDCRILVSEIFGYYRKQLRVPRVALLGSSPEVPEFLRRPDIRKARYRSGNAAERTHLCRVDVERARRVLVLKNPAEKITDAQVVSTTLTVREMNPTCTIYAEVRRAETAAAVKLAGGPETQPVLTREFQGLFLASMVIFRGMRPLLEELISSQGKEIYSCLFGHLIMASTPPPDLATIPAFPELSRHAARRGVRLIGSFGAPENAMASMGKLHLRELPPAGRLAGLLGVAESFREMKDFGTDVGRGHFPTLPPPPPIRPIPRLDLPPPTSRLERVLLCGFREQTIVLLEQLARYAGRLDATVLVPETVEIDAARASLLAPAPRGLARRRVTFVEEGPRSFRAMLADGSAVGALRLVPGDWSLLADLSAHVPEHDVVVVSSDPGTPDPDARTTTALLKLAHLLEVDPGRFRRGLRVVGELQDQVKAQELERRLRAPATVPLSIDLVATNRLRNEFLAQNIMVPGIADVLGEILSQGGEQLVRLTPAAPPADPWATLTFDDLSAAFIESRRGIALGVELRDGRGPYLCPDDDHPAFSFRAGDLAAAYALGPFLEAEG